MSGRTLEMRVKGSDGKVIATQQTDKKGRFRFTGVPCKVPLQFDIRNEDGRPEYFLFDRNRMFNPGEVRDNDQLKPSRPGRLVAERTCFGSAAKKPGENLP